MDGCPPCWVCIWEAQLLPGPLEPVSIALTFDVWVEDLLNWLDEEDDDIDDDDDVVEGCKLGWPLELFALFCSCWAWICVCTLDIKFWRKGFWDIASSCCDLDFCFFISLEYLHARWNSKYFKMKTREMQNSNNMNNLLKMLLHCLQRWL